MNIERTISQTAPPFYSAAPAGAGKSGPKGEVNRRLLLIIGKQAFLKATV